MDFTIQFNVWGMKNDDVIYEETLTECFSKDTIEEAKEFVLANYEDYDEFIVFNEKDGLLFDEGIREE